MKLMRKLTTITLLAILSFIGVGFAAWTFTAPQTVQEVSTITDEVAVAIELNDGFKLYRASDDSEITTLYLICDAPTEAVSGRYLAGLGVYWATRSGEGTELSPYVYTQVPANGVYIKGTLTKNVMDGVNDKSSVTVSFTGSKTSFGAQSYVNFGDMTIADKVVATTSAGSEIVVQSDNFTLAAPSYTATATAIASISDLEDMDSALGTALASAKLTFTAQITA